MTVFWTEVKPILTGWREKKLPILWRFALKLSKELLLHHTKESRQKNITTYSAYNPPSLEALVRYMHVASGFPVKPTWLRAKKRGKFWDMARTNILKCGKLLPTRSGKNQRAQAPILSRSAINQEEDAPHRCIKKGIFKVASEEEEMEDIPPPIKTKELHIWYQSISKLYTDDYGHLTIRSRSGND